MGLRCSRLGICLAGRPACAALAPRRQAGDAARDGCWHRPAAAAASVAFLIQPILGLGWLVALLDFVRVAVTLGFLLAFLGVRGGVRKAERGGQGWAPLIGLGLLLLTLWFLVGVRPPGIVEPNALIRQLAYGSALGVAAFGLVLVEQCYRRTPLTARWHVRPLILGFAGLFAFDVALYSDALLFRTLDFDLWFARGFAQALTVPLMLVTLRRRGRLVVRPVASRAAWSPVRRRCCSPASTC